MTTMALKPGTRIELNGMPAMGGLPEVKPELATIARWSHGPRGALPGYHAVRFEGGGSLLVHESRFRVISNR